MSLQHREPSPRVDLVADGTFTAEQAAKKLGMTEEAFEEAVQTLNVKS